jgi:alkylation response protein AidB-like acyl-CoA dehydrogenase
MTTPLGEHILDSIDYWWDGMHPITEAGALALDAANDLVPVLRAASDKIDLDHRLPAEVCEAMGDAGIWNLMAPECAGGGKVDYPTVFRVLEQLGYGDGSAGWSLLTHSAGAYIASWLPEEGAEALFEGRYTCIAGSPTPFGAQGHRVDGGWIVSGEWMWATGLKHATHTIGGFPVLDDDGEMIIGDHGLPISKTCYFRADEIEIVEDSWDAIGMLGTHSGKYVANEVFVPDMWTVDFPPDGAPPLRNVLPVGVVGGHCWVHMGIARHAIEALVDVAKTKVHMSPMGMNHMKNRQVVQLRIAEASAMVRACRAWGYENLDRGWAMALAGQDVTKELMLSNQLHNTHTARVCKEAVQMLFDLATTTAVYRTNEIDKCLRDILTACAHMSVQEVNFERIGKALLGFPINLRAGAF